MAYNLQIQTVSMNQNQTEGGLSIWGWLALAVIVYLLYLTYDLALPLNATIHVNIASPLVWILLFSLTAMIGTLLWLLFTQG